MSNAKKAPKPSLEELQTAMQALIEQGKKEGIIKAADLNAILEKMDLNAEKIEGIYDNIEAITAAHAKGAELSLDNAVSGMTVPFHAGAAKYYAEHGIEVAQ